MNDGSSDASRLRVRKAQIEQRHLQFGRHCSLDVGGLMRAANRVQAAQPGLSPQASRNKAINLTEKSTHPSFIEGHAPPDAARVAAPPSSKTTMTRIPTSGCHRSPGPAILGDFTSSSEAGTSSSGEWVATLTDRTSVIVEDSCGTPSSLGIAKAVSIVQSRYYLEQRARRLLMPFAEADSVRLVAIDFASEARKHGSEFLMCFAVQDATGAVLSTSAVVKIGFSLPAPVAVDPVFVLTVVAAVGFW